MSLYRDRNEQARDELEDAKAAVVSFEAAQRQRAEKEETEQPAPKTGAQPPGSDASPTPSVSLSTLLDETVGLLGRYLVLSPKQLIVIALWVAHSYVIDSCHTTPYLLVRSPEKRSGKTRLLEVLELIVCRPWSVATPSEAALFRKLADKPCLLLDEIDAVFSAAKSDRNEQLRAILNAGYRPGMSVPRCVGEGSKQTVQDFPVFGAKVLAGINNRKLPDTIEDRCVTIEMQRKAPGEHVARFRRRDADAETEPIRLAFGEWATSEVGERLYDARPELPSSLNDRAQDAVEVLLAIADEAGDKWPEQARSAIRAVVGGAEVEDSDTILALRLIKAEFGDRKAIGTTEIAEALNADDEAPFGAWRKGEGIDARGVAKLFKPFGISSKNVRLDDDSQAKGYTIAQLRPLFERYIPSIAPETGVHSSQRPKPNNDRENERFSSVPDEPGVDAWDGAKAAKNPINTRTWDGGTDNTPLTGRGRRSTTTPSATATANVGGPGSEGVCPNLALSLRAHQTAPAGRPARAPGALRVQHEMVPLPDR